MVYNTKNTTFATKEQLYHVTPAPAKQAYREWQKQKEDLAAAADTFGGRRLLGVTDKDQPIWASYTIDKETLTINIKLSHTLDTIRLSKLCPRRITLATGENLHNLEHAMRPANKTDHGEVTQNTINYLEKVIDMVESGTVGKEKGKCTTSLFRIVSNLLYEGSGEHGKFRWDDVMRTWNMPKGSYLTVYG